MLSRLGQPAVATPADAATATPGRRLSAANKTQRSAPDQAHDRRQYNKYGKVVQQRQEGFVSDA